MYCIGYVHQSEKKVPCCIPRRGKGAHLFIVDLNLSMDMNQVYMILYIKTKLEMQSKCKKKKKTTYEKNSFLFNMKILQHPQWKKGKEVQLLSYYLLLSSLKKDLLNCMQFFLNLLNKRPI